MKKIYFLLLLIISSLVVEAQQGLATYTATRNTGITYTSISGTGNVFPSWRNGLNTDDNMSTAVPIGFDFVYDGVKVCQANISTNGFLNLFTSTELNGATGYNWINTNFSLANGTLRTIAPFYDDLRCLNNPGDIIGLNDAMFYQTTGTAPNRIFTAEWRKMETFSNPVGTDFNFQVKLFEGSNSIRIIYASMVSPAALTYTTGINSITLTGTPTLSMLYTQQTANTATFSQVAQNALTTVPTTNSEIVLTYGGAAVSPLSGVFTIPGSYATIGAAINALNYHGTSGACTFNVAAGSVFTEDPAPLQTSCGAFAITFQKSGAGANPVLRATTGNFATLGSAIRIMGGDAITFDGIDITINSGSALNFGYLLTQNSNTNGAQTNIIQNSVITLNRTNTNSRGIIQSSTLTPASVTAGANSNNIYRNFTIKNSYAGLQLAGSATVAYGGLGTINCPPDQNNQVTTSACGTYNIIGDPATPNDIGNGALYTFGIAAFNQAAITIRNTKIQNITSTGLNFVDGIFILNSLPAATSGLTSTITNNQISTLRATNTGANPVSGLSLNNNANAGTILRVYNNFISDLSSASTTTTPRRVIGIGLQDEAGTTGAGSAMEIWHNSVSLSPSGIACSNACLESFQTTNAPVLTVRNNILANLTGAQSGNAKHYAIASSSATVWGSAGSTSNFNDLYIASTTNGFVGLGAATDYGTVAAWTAAVAGNDANSINTDPSFAGPSDLHVGAVALNNSGTAAPAYITTDIDCQSRPQPVATNFDMGADETQQCAVIVNGGTITPASVLRCANQTYTMDAVGATTGIGISLQWEVSPTGGGVGFVDVVGGSAANSTPYTSAPLSAGTFYYRLRVICSSGPITVYSNELQVTVNPAPIVGVSPSSGFLCQPTASTVTLTASGGLSYAWSPAAGLSAITGNPVTAGPQITTVYTVTGTDGNGCTATATSTISVGSAFTLTTTATPPAVCGGNSQLNTVVNPVGNEIIITEVTINRFGTGQTTPYPAYIGSGDADFVEISNITSQAVDISGWTIADYGNNLTTAVHPFTFPAGTIIPGNAVAVIHLGGGTTSIPNRYYNTGGGVDTWFSGDLLGIVLKNSALQVMDAVGIGTGYTFNATTGVTAANWTGFAPAPIGFAGTIRTGATDTNTGGDWSAAGSPSPLQTIGTYNGGYTNPLSIASYAWSPATFLSSTTIANPVAIGVSSTTAYTVLVTSTVGCSATGNVTVTVAPIACTSITSTGPRCVGSPTSITVNTTGGCAPYNYAWTIDGVPFATNAATITPTILTAGPHLFAVNITSGSGNCNISQNITINALPTITVNPPTSSICNPGGLPVVLTASGGSTYSWNPSGGLSAITGAVVTATPVATTTYTATGTDVNGCVSTGTAFVGVGPAITVVANSSAAGTICPGTNSTTLTAVTTFPSFTYCNSRHTSGCALNDQMTNVSIPTTTLNNASGCAASAYTYFNGGGTQTGTLSPGGYNITVSFGSDGVGQFFGAWIDYNQDGVLSVSEFLGASGNAGSNGTISVAFTVPAGALNGVTRLRVVGGNDVAVSADQACDVSSSSFGETEDYDVTITGATNPLSYSWSPATFLSSTVTNPTTAVNMTSTQTYTVTATTASGCAATNTVTVNVHPDVTGTISGDATICPGGSTTISVALTGTAPWSITYTANGGSPVTVPVINTSPYTFVVSPIVLTTYALTVVDDASPCTAVLSGTAVVTVNPDPTITVNPPAPSYCPGGSVVLTASGATTYLWSPAGGLSATTGAVVTANPGGTTTYTVTGDDPFSGCSGSTTVTVTVTPNAPVSVTIVSSSGATICAGESVTFTATPVNGGATPAYQWLVNGLPAPGGTNSTTYTTTGLIDNDIVTVELTSNAACATGNPATSPGILMDVIASGPASVTIAASATLCSGTPITFTATPVNGGTPTYQWFLNGSPVVPPVSIGTYTLPLPVNGNTVWAVMTSSLTCATGSPATSPTYTVALNPSPGTSAPSSDCNPVIVGNSFTLTNTAAPGGASTITNYQWVLSPSTNVAITPTYTTAVTGTYFVTLTNSFGCTSSTSTITVNPNTAALNAGTYNIPGAGCNGFPNIAAAVTHLTSYGIANNGPVIFDIAGGYTETAPPGGFALSGLATGVAGSTITFKKVGGANPQVTAGSQVVGSTNDAIFKLIGADYIIIQDLNLLENAVNNVNTPIGSNKKTEWGIALLHANGSPTNGAQNNTIQNNSITLDRAYPNSFGIYSNARHDATTPGTNQEATTVAGRNSLNKVYTNVINNVNTPILFIGAAANMDAGNDIGGVAAGTANTISNWGSNTANSGSGSFNSVPGSVFGIYASNQTGLNISFNSVVSAAGITAGGSGLRGVFADFNGTPAGTFTNAITNNTITLNSAGAPGAFEAINQSNTAPSGAVAGMTLNINTNSIIDCAATGAAAGTTIVGISNAFPAGVLSITDNIIRSNSSTATTGGITGISNSGAVATTITINNNKFGDASGDYINFSAATTGAVNGILNTGGAATAALSVQTNDFRRIVYAAASASANTYISNTAATLSQNISSNTFTNLSLNTAAGNVTFITNSVTLPAAGIQTVSSNVVVTGFAKTNAGGTILFYNASPGVASNSTSTITCSNNNFSNMSFVSSPISGWQVTDAGPGNKTISTNTFNNISNGASAMTIINASGTGTAPGTSISGNTIGNITGTNTVTGINVPSGSAAPTVTVSGNGITFLSGTVVTGINSANLTPNITITTNNINNNSSTGNNLGIALTTASTLATINTNDINTLTSTSAASSTVAGMQLVNAATNANVGDNTIHTLSFSGAGASPTVNGIQVASGATYNLTNNTIHTLSNTGTANPLTNGILIAGGTTVGISKNRIYNLSQNGNPSNITTALVNGISVSANIPSLTASNNYISDLKAPLSASVDAVRGISLSVASGAASYNIFYNTIYLKDSSSAANSGSSGIFHTANGTPGNGTLNLRNNIIDNRSVSRGTGLTVALRRNGVNPGNYATSSNNNLFYAGVPQASPRLIYYDGTNSDATLAAFQTRVGPTRENVSIGVRPNYMDSTVKPYNLHLVTSFNCSIDGMGNNSGILIADDNDATNVRSILTPFITDIGADEFTGSGSGAGVWRGVNTDWMDVQNWCGEVPTVTTDVTIPNGAAFYPIITTALPVARNITVANLASITINTTGTLSTKGSWDMDGTLTNNGTIVLNGTVNQAFPGAGSTGTLAAMTNLTANNTPGGVTIDKPVTITGTLRPQAGPLSVNEVVTLHSDASGTARVDNVTGTIAYNGPGKFSVERYISSATKVAWRFLAAPIALTGSPTINAAWQEGQAAGIYTPTGYGMQIVGPTAAGAGFDMNNTLPSVKTYAPASNSWVTIPGTTGLISSTQGYMAFIRGDRGSNTFGSQSATTLRMAGQIKTGAVSVSTANGNTNTFISVGNPYPSAIDFLAASTVKTGLQAVYYLWDPQLGTYGAYQTFSSGNGYVANPGGGSYGGGSNFIESGQAFFVISNAAVAPHSIAFAENSKVASNVQVARPAFTGKQLATRLYVISGSQSNLYDGNLIVFDGANSNVVDDNDAPKLGNFGENIGILTGGKLISVESRSEIVDRDTIFYALGQMRQQQYKLEFSADQLAAPGLTAWLEDAYLNTSTVISLEGVTAVNFSVNGDVGSYAANRFRIVFRQLAPVPVSFTSVRADKQGKNVLVSWKVENELNIDHYEIEKSADGRNFGRVGTKAATGNGTSTANYSWLDLNAFKGDNFYRIISVDNSGINKQSEVVKVNFAGDPAIITIYPNPVNDDGVVNIRMENLPKGIYYAAILNNVGQVVHKEQLNHEGGSSVYSIRLKNIISHGNYVLQVLEADKVKTTFKIVY